MTSPAHSPTLIVTGGGTAGHVSPALAVAEAYRRSHGGSGSIRFVGMRDGIEAKIVAHTIPFIAIRAGKLRRAHGLRAIFSIANLRDAFQVPLGVLDAIRIIRHVRADVVFSTGGFVSVPVVVAARLLGVPVVVHEQTVRLGLANRLASLAATRVCLAYEASLRHVPRLVRRKCEVVGNPVRPELFTGDRVRAIGRFFPGEEVNLPVVYVTGGSLGAAQINDAVLDGLPALLAQCFIIHQCGRSHDGRLKRLANNASSLDPLLRRRYHVQEFLAAELADALELADVVVSRAGANSIAEICALGKAALLIPLEPTVGDEQVHNADYLGSQGAALVLRRSQFTTTRFVEEVAALCRDSQRRTMQASMAKDLAGADGARRIVEIIASLCR